MNRRGSDGLCDVFLAFLAFLALLALLASSRHDARHPWLISCASGRPSHFLLNGQEKVTKEKATPEARPLDIPVPRVRESGPGFVDSTSMY